MSNEGRTVPDSSVLRELRTIPGVGDVVSRDLWQLGVRAVGDLKGNDPETLYSRLCGIQDGPVDRCMLYVLRCAVYYASTEQPEPELLEWWNWSDSKLEQRARREADVQGPSPNRKTSA